MASINSHRDISASLAGSIGKGILALPVIGRMAGTQRILRMPALDLTADNVADIIITMENLLTDSLRAVWTWTYTVGSPLEQSLK